MRAVVLPAEGGRLGSLTVDGRELLVTSSPRGRSTGAATRWRRGPAGSATASSPSAARAHRLPLGMPPHAIHGVVFDRPWRMVDAATIAVELDERWPFRGRVTQRFALQEDGLEVAMTLEADEPMPAVLGWHRGSGGCSRRATSR